MSNNYVLHLSTLCLSFLFSAFTTIEKSIVFPLILFLFFTDYTSRIRNNSVTVNLFDTR